MHTDISGPVSSFGKYSVEGVKMRMNEINENGGIHGRKLVLFAEDHQYQVPRAVQAANKLINKDKIFLMLASLGTPMNNAVFQMQEGKDIPNLFPLSSARSMTDPLHRLKFGALSSYYDQIRSGVKWAVEDQGKNKICVLYQDNDFGQETYDAVIDQLSSMNLSLHEKATNKPTDTDLTSQITKLKNADCEAVAMGTIVKDTIIGYAKAKQMGWDALFFGQVASFHPVIASQPGGITDGFYTFAQFDTPSKSTCSEEICNWIDKYESLFGNTPNIGSAYGYMYMDVTARALEIAGHNLTTESFIEALESIKDYKIPFGQSILSWGPEKHLGANDAFLFVVQDGKFVQVDDVMYNY
jgi:branched-chain amino acid transport system substrate-binding protein